MTVSSTTNRNNYTGNGATGTYSYTFKVFDEADLTVVVRDPSDVETTLALGVAYTVTGVGATAGGTIIIQETGQAYTDGAGNLETGYTLTIRRVLDLKQETDIRNQGEFFAEVHEEAFDKVVMQNQQQQDEIDRAIKLSETQTGVDTTLPSPTAGYAIGWNGTADALTNIASAGNLIVSPFGESLLDDANAAAARTTLDAAQSTNSLPLESAPALDDYIPIRDTSEGADNRISTEDLLKVVNELSEETSAAAGDYTLMYDASAGAAKKILTSNLVGAASGVELLQTQAEMAAIGFGMRPLDNSIRVNGLEIPPHKYFTGYLIENYSSGASNAKIVWNPVVLNDSDKDADSATGYSATGAGASLSATAGSNKVGSNKFTFDKNGTAVEAGVRYDRGSQNLSVGANYRVFFWINLPSITNLTNVGIRMYADTTSNFRTWTTTTQIDVSDGLSPSALATGWNLIFFDLSDTTGSTTGGTGWTYTTLSRYVEVFVTASSAAQTYSAILLDGMWFSHGDISALGPHGLEYTMYDTSNKNNFTISYNASKKDGRVPIGLMLQSYTAGISAAAAAKVVRSSMSWSQAGLIGFDTALSSGAVALEQELRDTRVVPTALSGANLAAFFDLYSPQIYKVTTVGGSSIGVADSENHSANLVNNDQVYVFNTYNSMFKQDFSYLATRTITGSSHSSGTTTINMTTSGIAVGDIIVKKVLTASSSVVSTSSGNENFSTMTATPSLIGSRSYPNPNNVYAHWWLGGPSNTLAIKDQTGNSRDITAIGGLNRQDAFKSGKYGASGFSTSNYFRTTSGTGETYNGNGETIFLSYWVYYAGTNGTDRHMAADRRYDGASLFGWDITVNGSASSLLYRTWNNSGSASGSISGGSMAVGSWNHVFLKINTGVSQMWLNGVSIGTTTGVIYPGGTGTMAFYLGALCNSTAGTDDSTMSNPATDLKMADAIVWRNGSMSQSDVNYLYNAGVPQWIGYNPAVVREEYPVTSASGNRLSIRGKLNRTTNAVSPYVLSGGIIKT